VIVERSIDLPCPIEEAWAVLTRWERQADWMLDADEVVVRSAHRAGVGVRLDVRTRLFQIPAFVEPMEVTAWEPPRSLSIAHGGPVRGSGTWSLAPIEGGSRFTWAEDVELAFPMLGEVLARAYRPVMGTLMGRAQRGLRSLIIASGPARGSADAAV
jgi:polyketide cyclase/dehydrase/lipid transport protein